MEDRIKQWATWYRTQMYGCDWLLNTNMHVESWHNFLKTHIMERRNNVRVDKLLQILIQAETYYFWKWSRIQCGAHVEANPGWAVVHGHTNTTSDIPTSCVGSPRQLLPAPTKREEKQHSLTETIAARVETIRKVVHTKHLPVERQRAVLKQLTSVLRVYETEGRFNVQVITQPCFGDRVGAKRRVIPTVKPQYQFRKKKKSRVMAPTNMKAFRNSPDNRVNHMWSFRMSCRDEKPENHVDVDIVHTMVTLSVKRTTKQVTLDGITFLATIGGIVVG